MSAIKLPAKDRAALRRLSEDDRRWFEARPGREFRLRKPAPRELGMMQAQGASHVLVRQVQPGFRMRLPMLCSNLPDVDPVLRRLWNEGAVYVPLGGRA
jgi:hypothetical protein